jgi:hypothetical protein
LDIKLFRYRQSIVHLDTEYLTVLSILVSDRCTIRRVSAGRDVLGSDCDDVTATKLAVDRQINGEVASAAFESEIWSGLTLRVWIVTAALPGDNNDDHGQDHGDGIFNRLGNLIERLFSDSFRRYRRRAGMHLG